MPPTGGPPSENPADRIKALEDRLAELERRSLSNAAVTSGALTVKSGASFDVLHPNGSWVVHVGAGAGGKYFFTLRRDDGSPAIELGTTVGGDQYVAMWDRTGHIVASDDAASGTGLARPWLPLPGMPVAAASLPTTASGTYTAVWSTGYPTKQQPQVTLVALLLSNAGATGNARYTINGAPVGTVMPIPANSFGWQAYQTIPWSGDIDQPMVVELELQRTNAVGSVAGAFMGYQRQS